MKYFLWLMIVLTVSCTSKKTSIPKDILPLSQMADVMVDVHLVEAAKNVSMPDDKSNYTTRQYYYTYVFSKHHITNDQFQHSLDFYKSRPELMEEIYTEVINKLSELQSKTGNH